MLVSRKPTIGEHGERMTGVQVDGRVSRCGPGTMAPKSDDGRDGGQCRGGDHHRPPGQRPETVDQVRERGSEGQRPDQDSERAPSIGGFGPRGHQLQPHRVDTGQHDPGGNLSGIADGETVREEGERSGARGGAAALLRRAGAAV